MSRLHADNPVASGTFISLPLSHGANECPELLDETIALLRSRLHKVAFIFAIGFLLFLSVSFFLDYGNLRLWLAGGALFHSAVAYFLRQPVCLPMRQLRLLELGIFGSMGAFHTLRQFLVVDEILARDDLALMGASACMNVLIWFFLVVIYAMFIPNTWRRAAVVIGIMSAAPLAINALIEWQHPRLAAILPAELRVAIVVVTFMGGAAATYGTHIINRLRTQTFETEARARAIFNTTPEGIITSDTRGIIQSFNPAAERLFGWTAEEVIGKSVNILMPGPESREHDGHMERYLRSGQKRILDSIREVVGRRKDGSTFPIELAVAELRVQDQRLFTGIARDITVRKQYEAELHHAKELAEAANRAKSEFLANMSHEIRTPMNGILGMTELALDTELTPRQREFLRMVKSSADALLDLLNDILDFSKIEAGKIELENVEFRLREVIGDTLGTLALRAHHKRLELACHVLADVPDVLQGDPGRLRQIVVNLVGNAIKFTEHGEVVVRVATEAVTEDYVYLHLTVTDTGVGIPREKQSLIFNAFEQADSSTTRQHGGTGLGLAISSELAHMMGGRIWVESEAGKGSTFHVTARFGVLAAAEEAMPSDLMELRGLRVLVVDDNATNRLILQEVLTNWQMRPELAESAEAAWQALETAEAQAQPFSLVLSDVHMPITDGFQLARQIKASARFAAKVVLLSSADRTGDMDRCRELGLAGHLIKPVRQSALLDTILRAFGKRQAVAEPSTRVAPGSIRRATRPLRILLAEDNEINQIMAINLLEKWGHQVRVANNGREALDLLKPGAFDVILMDVQMPEMDGFEATAAIRAREAAGERLGPDGPRLPIVAMTAHALKGDRERCLEAGMDGYVSKPIRSEELFQVLEDIGAKPGEGAGTAVPVGTNGEAKPILDHDALLNYVDGNRDLLRRIARRFLEKCPEMFSRIQDAVARRDAGALEFSAHALKGAVGNFFAKSAWDAAYRLETLGHEGDLDGAAAAVATLEGELDRLRPALSALENG